MSAASFEFQTEKSTYYIKVQYLPNLSRHFHCKNSKDKLFYFRFVMLSMIVSFKFYAIFAFFRDRLVKFFTLSINMAVVLSFHGYTLLNIHEYSPRLFRGEHLLCIRDKNDVTCQ